MTFTPDSSWQEFIDWCWGVACSRTGFTREDQCPTVLCARELDAGSLADSTTAMVQAAEHDNEAYTLLRWLLFTVFDAIPIEQRLVMEQRLGEIDYPLAAVLHEEGFDLTRDEQALLRSFFWDRMPIYRERIEAREANG